MKIGWSNYKEPINNNTYEDFQIKYPNILMINPLLLDLNNIKK